MQRPIVGLKSPSTLAANVRANDISGARLAPAEYRKRMGVKRSEKYVALISSQLDAGTHTPDSAQARELLHAISEEFPELALAELPSGIVAKCYLGAPYEVHTLDAALGIVEHYRAGHSLPLALEKARLLAQHPDYAFVEVYGSELRPVFHDGRVTSVPLSENKL